MTSRLRAGGLGEDLVDASIDIASPGTPLTGGSLVAANALDLAQKLTKGFKIIVRSAVADLGRSIDLFQIAPG